VERLPEGPLALNIPAIDETHDPARTSWVESARNHPEFPVQNLPLGVFSPPASEPRCGVAIGDEILDLRAAAEAGLLPERAAAALGGDVLNSLLALPSGERVALRRRISDLLSDPAARTRMEPLLHAAADCRLHLPARIGDYTDFYAGIHHAVNVGRLFRPDNPLLPNYKYVPIGYHGRASSIRPSGAPVIRPKGQAKAPSAEAPSFRASSRLDYEVELGFWIGQGVDLGATLPISAAAEHIAGVCLLNDWSARDLQAWEYQPLGPFLAKNFHTTVSPWIVTAEALAPYRIPQPSRPEGDPRPLDYLWDETDQAQGAFAIELEAFLVTERMRKTGRPPHRLSRAPASAMYWTAAQLVAHHTSNGCDLAPGDLLGSGTISAPKPDGFGSLLELTDGGAEPVRLPDGETRGFLQDGDELILSARAAAEGRAPIGFGPCRAVVTRAR
jgi:fumarylacetoacetase